MDSINSLCVWPCVIKLELERILVMSNYYQRRTYPSYRSVKDESLTGEKEDTRNKVQRNPGNLFMTKKSRPCFLLQTYFL